jgi:hypothetical protein
LQKGGRGDFIKDPRAFRHKKTFPVNGRLIVLSVEQRMLPPLPSQPHRAILKGHLLKHKAVNAVKQWFA